MYDPINTDYNYPNSKSKAEHKPWSKKKPFYNETIIAIRRFLKFYKKRRKSQGHKRRLYGDYRFFFTYYDKSTRMG